MMTKRSLDGSPSAFRFHLSSVYKSHPFTRRFSSDFPFISWSLYIHIFTFHLSIRYIFLTRQHTITPSIFLQLIFFFTFPTPILPSYNESLFCFYFSTFSDIFWPMFVHIFWNFLVIFIGCHRKITIYTHRNFLRKTKIRLTFFRWKVWKNESNYEDIEGLRILTTEQNFFKKNIVEKLRETSLTLLCIKFYQKIN